MHGAKPLGACNIRVSAARLWTASSTGLLRRLYLHLCFTHKTELSFTLSSRLAIQEALLSNVSTGDAEPIREYVSYAR